MHHHPGQPRADESNFDEERTGTGSRRSSRSNRQEVATRRAALLGTRIAWALSQSVSRLQTGTRWERLCVYCQACVYAHIDYYELIKDFCAH